MSQSTELHVPDGYYPPFAVVTDTDHGAYIIIAVTLGITFVLVSSLIRIFLRITFLQRAGLDDAFLAAGTVSGFAINYWSISDLLSRFLHLYSHVLF
jgi:hypothetical protein